MQKKAKQKYYQRVIDELDHKNIFRAVRWSSSVRHYKTPPIWRQGGTFAIDNLGKQRALRQELLKPPSNGNVDCTEPPNLRQETKANYVPWQLCTIQEIETAIFQVENTSPGPDGIPSSVIKKAWPTYKEEITRLFQMCLQEGYHPRAFRNATLCALSKPENAPAHSLNVIGL